MTLYKFCVFVDGFFYYIFHIISNMLFRLFIQLIRVDRLSILDNDMSLSDSWNMILKDLRRIIHGYGNDRTAGLRRDFESQMCIRDRQTAGEAFRWITKEELI